MMACGAFARAGSLAFVPATSSDDYLDTRVRVERFERARRRLYLVAACGTVAFVVGVLIGVAAA